MTILCSSAIGKIPTSCYFHQLKSIQHMFGQPIRWLTHTQVATAIRPIYSKVHPDLFGQYPRAQHVNEASLKQLRSHLDTLLDKRQPRSTTLQFYVRDDVSGELDVVTIALNHSGLRSTLQSVLSSLKLPLAPLSKMVEAASRGAERGPDRTIIYRGRPHAWDHFEPRQRLSLYDWLVQNMWRAEKQMLSAAPVRKDIARLKERLIAELDLARVSSDRATSTTRLRGCLTGVLELYRDYPDLRVMLAGRSLHFGNVTGVSLAGSVVLGTSEVKSQWLSCSSSIVEYSSSIAEYSSSIAEYSSSIAEYSSSIAEYSSFIAQYSSSIAEYSSSIAEYSSSIAEYSSSIAECSSSIVEYSSSIAEYSSSIAEYSSSIAEYSSSIAEYSSSIAEYSSSIAEYSSSIAEYSSSIAEYSSSIAEYSSSIAEYSSSIAEYSSSIAEYSSSIAEYSSSIAEYSSSIAEYSSSIAEYSSSITEYSSSIAEYSSSSAEQFIQQLPEVDAMLSRIPDLQRAVSIGLRGIQVTHRKFGGSVVARGYGHDLKRLVTSLSDHRGRHGLPSHWPMSLSHLQLVVEPASGPMMLSPSGQLLVPSSCPAAQMLTFISDHLQHAPGLLLSYSEQKQREKTMHTVCVEVFALEMLQKDDSVVPEEMLCCLERLLNHSERLLPLLSGARVWVTRYYAVMLDGEICLPWHWDLDDEQLRDFRRNAG
ncbi:protein of unknown function DUF4461 [Trinorchestia longiramus]|nr:protein of unknown function DUF4461 [Trinorchestia longiramus]